MLDHAMTLPDRLRRRFAEAPPSLAQIFEAGEQLAALDPSGLPTQRIAVLGALTTDFIARAVAVGVALEGVLAQVYQAPFGAIVQEVLDPSSGVHGFDPELVVLAPDWRDVVEVLPPDAGQDAADAAVAAQVGLFTHLWDRLSDGGRRRIIQHTLPGPEARFCGIAERLMPGSAVNQVRRLNEALLQAGRGRVSWVDMEALAGRIGSERFAPNRFYHNARLPFEGRYLPAYLPAFRGAWRLAHGQAKKALILDLDNTLWGGVIGDDGVDGLRLGSGSPAGEAFAEWQGYVKALAARGVVLAVCSKNDPAIAETGFTHPGSVLARGDFAAFECGWGDKAEAIRRIAAQLNLGLSSFVFCDDNPAECALVRETLPEVVVVPMGEDPTAFIARLDAGHWFDFAQYTAEDTQRGAMYAARAGALAEAATATDIGAYLSGLKMRGRVFRPAEEDMARVAQLEMKTNQFNMSTRRHTEAALRGFLDRADAVVLALRLGDRFGDHGLVSTLIAVAEGDALRIDSWLMSCRVFSRSAEPFMLRALLAIAAQRGTRRLIGEYLLTARNGVVAELYARLGFTRRADGLWERLVGPPDPTGLDTAIQAVE
jgi:FkbH-like protein